MALRYGGYGTGREIGVFEDAIRCLTEAQVVQTRFHDFDPVLLVRVLTTRPICFAIMLDAASQVNFIFKS